MKREETYRFFVADALHCIAENTSHVKDGRYIGKTLRDILYPPVEPVITDDKRSCRDVVMDMFRSHKSSKKGG